MRSSQLFLLGLLNYIVLCFGQQTPVDGTQYEYYLPANVSDISDEKLKGLVRQEGDQWKMNLNRPASNEPLDIILFMDHTHSLEFTLAADDLNAIAAKYEPNEIYLTLGDGAKESKKIMVQWQSETGALGKKSVIMKVFINNERKEVGTLAPSNRASPRFFVDYKGNVWSDIANRHQETNEPLLPNDQPSANFKVSISWKNLQSDFTISFPSSIFRAKRPVPPPPTTTTIMATSTSFGGNGSDSSSTEVSSAKIDLWIIIVPCVVGVLVIVGVSVGIWYFCYRKKFNKNELPLVPPSAVTTVVVPSKEVSKPVDPPKVEAPAPSRKKAQTVRSPPSQKPSKTKGEVESTTQDGHETTGTGATGATTQSTVKSVKSIKKQPTSSRRMTVPSTRDANNQQLANRNAINENRAATVFVNAPASIPVKAKTPPKPNQYHAVYTGHKPDGYEAIAIPGANLPPPPKD